MQQYEGVAAQQTAGEKPPFVGIRAVFGAATQGGPEKATEGSSYELLRCLCPNKLTAADNT